MSGQDHGQPASGAQVALAQLIGLRFAARQLKLSRTKRALTALAGPVKSNFRGRGIDFEEVRFYQPGDDIRTIDWRVTARTGEAHTKLFREERERPVLVVVDQRGSMYFGSRHCFKSVLACHLAGLLAWSALDHGDRVGGLVFNGLRHREIRPRRSRRTVLALLSELERFNRALPLAPQQRAETFAATVDHLRRIARPGSSIYLISDFHGAEETAAGESLFRLAQHTEVTALLCADRLEQELPRAGRYAVTDGHDVARLHSGDRDLQQRYRDTFTRRLEGLQQHLRRSGIPLLRADTAASPFNLLQTYYGERRR